MAGSPTAFTGAATTKDPVANELIIDMRNSIAQLEPQVAQFTTMLSKLPTENAKSFKVEWLDDEIMPTRLVLSASAASADTSFAVAASGGLYVTAGSVLRIVETGEAVLVTGTPTSTAITATRGIGTVTAASATSASELVSIGHSDTQAATLPTILMTKRTANYNFLGFSFEFTLN